MRELIFRPSAESDLDAIDDHIAMDSPERARRFVERIQTRCLMLAEFPDSGLARPDLGPNFKTIAFDRRVVIVYRVAAEVEIVRIFYGGRDYEALFGPDEG